MHAVIEDAQKAELIRLIVNKAATIPSTICTENVETVVDIIMDQKQQFIDVLTTKPDSRPKARKVNGGTKKRKSEQPQSTSTAQ